MYYTNRYGTTEAGGRQSLVFGAGETEKSFTLAGYNGKLAELSVELPNWTNDVTATVRLIRANNVEHYASAALSRNNNYAIIMNWRTITGNETIKLVLSGVPGGAGGTAYVTPIME